METLTKRKNVCGKTKTANNPYEVWVDENSGWEWRVLKKYQAPHKEATNKFARWFCAVKSPFTRGEFEYGDVYVREIIEHARMQERNYDLSTEEI